MSDALAALGRRIEQVALAPEGIAEQAVFRVVKPLYALTRWRATLRHSAIRELLPVLERATSEQHTSARLALEAAIRELEGNVDAIERVAILRKRPPVAHAAWLRRAWELLVHVERVLASFERGAPDTHEQRLALGTDAVRMLPPLTLRDETTIGNKPFELEVAVTPRVPEAVADLRAVELELATLDHLLAAARDERRMLGRRRRLLVAARQRLLDVSAALPLAPEGERARASYIAQEIVRLDRLEGAGLAADVGLVQQARRAVDRGDRRRLHAALSAIDAAGLASADHELTRASGRALVQLWHGEDPKSAALVQASLMASAGELLGNDVVGDVRDAVLAAANAASAARHAARGAAAMRETQAVLESFVEADAALLRAAVAVDGCFEVGGALTPVRVLEEERYLERVRHPTQEQILVTARDLHDVHDAQIHDPRTVLLDLAAGRLLTRHFVREAVRRNYRVVTRSEARVYVLDGSGSMLGARARVRDALLLAELSTLIARLKAPGEIRCTLFFRYFDEELGAVTRVDSVSGARAAIRQVVSTVRSGGTDIEKALLASLEQVEVARELDPELSRAQIVLVTDGESSVDEAKIVQARAVLEGLPIGVSVIALGQENEALRELVARQRAAGERAFYHYLDDARIEELVRGDFAEGALHLPEVAPRAPELVARELAVEVGELVDELVHLERRRDAAALARLDAELQRRRETGEEPSAEGESARLEAHNRDRAALERRFARWFPPPPGGAPTRPAPGSAERDELDAAIAALASIAEVTMLVGGPELPRRAEAIELLERLLPDARLTPARYRELVREWPGALSPALAAVHAAAAPLPAASV